MQPCYSTIFVLASLLSFARPAFASVGFCLDQVPAGLEGTGYTAVSALTQIQCPTSDWCPLNATTKIFTYTNADTGNTTDIEYYWWSACCTGTQGQHLIPDSNGLPTCENGTSALECIRRSWQEKFEADFLGDSYDFVVAPGQSPTSPHIYGGISHDRVLCKCKSADANCIRPGSGDDCLVCKTDELCSTDGGEVQLSINFFKITAVDLRSSELKFSAWIRQIWTDPRLSYDYQCYGGLDYFEVQASSGNLENSRIWTPDIELYNHQTAIWGDGALGSRLAIVYSCWDGKPTRGGCGEVFFSRPGVLSALCRYSGLLNFPNDELSCDLEFAAWAIDGRHQDIIPRIQDGGVNWIDKPVAEGEVKAVTGLTSGSSFQDYRIGKASVTRQVAFYDCCPNSPYPTLLYNLVFVRSTNYYTFKLVIPSMVLTLLSFIAFYMNPETGERLGFGITMILAMLALDITASEMMPVCNEKTFMDYLSQVCLLFGCVSLLETGVVMFLYHQHSDNWSDAFSPSVVISLLRKCCRKTVDRHKDGATKSLVTLGSDDDVKLRHQTYQQIFFVLDKDFGGALDIDEVSSFGQYAMGDAWSRQLAQDFLDTYDTNDDKSLCINEFALFCEEVIYKDKAVEFIQQRGKGFLDVMDRKEMMRQDMWHHRSHKVDVVARWTIIPGFILFIVILYQMGEENLRSLAFDEGTKEYQMGFYVSGLLPTLAVLVVTCVMRLSKCCPCCIDEDHGNGRNYPSVNVNVHAEVLKAPERVPAKERYQSSEQFETPAAEPIAVRPRAPSRLLEPPPLMAERMPVREESSPGRVRVIGTRRP